VSNLRVVAARAAHRFSLAAPYAPVLQPLSGLGDELSYENRLTLVGCFLRRTATRHPTEQAVLGKQFVLGKLTSTIATPFVWDLRQQPLICKDDFRRTVPHHIECFL
jgi:hypothetical protein